MDWPGLLWPPKQVSLPLDDTAWVRGSQPLVCFLRALRVLSWQDDLVQFQSEEERG